jgi:hypothetical protein
VLATLTMDAAFGTASLLGGGAFTSDLIGLDLVGRWAASMAGGHVRHTDIRAEPGLRGEVAMGLAVHYATGIALTQAYYEILRRTDSRSGLLKATAYGAVTSVLPLLVMYPAWGLGPCARRCGGVTQLLRIMVLGHTVFGAGIGAWTALLERRTMPS